MIRVLSYRPDYSVLSDTRTSDKNFLQFGNQLIQSTRGRVPFGKSKNGFLILDFPDFEAERKAKPW